MFSQLSYQLAALRRLLQKLSSEQYCLQIPELSMASIGGHTRHILELLHCLRQGYHTGTADYINRERDLLLEQDPDKAVGFMDKLACNMAMPDKEMSVRDGLKDAAPVNSSYGREIVYQTEHVVHHLAMIKIALHYQGLTHLVDDHFGVAYATLFYRASLTN